MPPYVLAVTPTRTGGYAASISTADTVLIDGVYGDTEAEAAMTAAANSLPDTDQNGWRYLEPGAPAPDRCNPAEDDVRRASSHCDTDDTNVRRFLDISTAHVTSIVMERIRRVPGVIADTTPFGAWLWVPGDIDERLREEPHEIPRCVIDIWRLARSLGCDYVHLDRDAEVIPQLPAYDW